MVSSTTIASAGNTWLISWATQRVSIGFCLPSAMASSRHAFLTAAFFLPSSSARCLRDASPAETFFLSASKKLLEGAFDFSGQAQIGLVAVVWHIVAQADFHRAWRRWPPATGVTDAGCHGAITARKKSRRRPPTAFLGS